MAGNMAEPASTRTEVAGTSIPVLPARNLQETLAFFERLGFGVDYHQPDQYAIVRRGGIELHFTHTPDLDPWTSGGMAYIRVDDVRSLYDEFRASGALLVMDPGRGHEDLHGRWEAGESIARMSEPADEPWGMREFALIDPNNNLLRVGQVLPAGDGLPRAAEILAATETVLVVDWPSADVPESLVRAGFAVCVHGGPAPEDYFEYFLEGDEVVHRRVGRPPARADLVYSYRPIAELPEILQAAQAIGAKAIWTQSGVNASGDRDPYGCWVSPEEEGQVRRMVEGAGLVHMAQPYIGSMARQVAASGGHAATSIE